jgi:hypothetical protein
MDYISSFDFEDTEGLSSETFGELLKILDNPIMTEYYSTSDDYQESWFELGQKNEKMRKAGGFAAHCSSEF